MLIHFDNLNHIKALDEIWTAWVNTIHRHPCTLWETLDCGKSHCYPATILDKAQHGPLIHRNPAITKEQISIAQCHSPSLLGIEKMDNGE